VYVLPAGLPQGWDCRKGLVTCGTMQCEGFEASLVLMNPGGTQQPGGPTGRSGSLAGRETGDQTKCRHGSGVLIQTGFPR
jgi:hypothetical protein